MSASTVERTDDGWQKVECYNCGKKVTYHDHPISTTRGPLCKECRDALHGDSEEAP